MHYILKSTWLWSHSSHDTFILLLYALTASPHNDGLSIIRTRHVAGAMQHWILPTADDALLEQLNSRSQTVGLWWLGPYTKLNLLLSVCTYYVPLHVKTSHYSECCRRCVHFQIFPHTNPRSWNVRTNDFWGISARPEFADILETKVDVGRGAYISDTLDYRALKASS